ncbi:hypothetical protein Tco_0449315 [Tanacetum coccineum]
MKSLLVDDDLDEEEAIKVTKMKNLENDIEDETLEIDEIVNIKESRNHPVGNKRLLRVTTAQMEEGTTTTLAARLPILNPGEYDLWLMRIEQYFLMTDYSLWEVILNGNKVLKRTIREVEHIYEPTSAEEKQDRRNEIKARGNLLMALPNKD